MHWQPSRFPRVALASLALLIGAGALGQIAKTTPFGPPKSAGASAPPAISLEYSGFIQTRDGLQFRVRDPARRKAAFVPLHAREPELDVIVRGYDSETGALTVEQDGRVLTLPEPKGKVRPSAPGALLPSLRTRPANAPPRVSPDVLRTVVPNPTPAQEIERLEAVVAEIRKRREEREKAARENK